MEISKTTYSRAFYCTLEAEYMSLSRGAQDIIWMHQLLTDMHYPEQQSTVL